ncbi:MAG TPA: cytochrome P460 family protein [Terriglobia bacterium]|nr:cytochrome P460 family protein [Terriglobia bacterium]
MTKISYGMAAILVASLALVGDSAVSTQDRYSLKVPGGLAFSEIRGYEDWQTIAVSETAGNVKAILGNPTMIRAYREGIPDNGKPFPDGSKTVKISWIKKKNPVSPYPVNVPGALHDVSFMVKDSKRFADSAGWGWAVFKYDAASHTFRPGNTADKPPQGNDAKCGLACHTIVKSRDYVFTDYGHR